MIRTYYSVAYSFWSKWYWTAAFQWRLKFSSSFTLEPLNDPSTLLSFTANTMYSFGDDVYLSLYLRYCNLPSWPLPAKLCFFLFEERDFGSIDKFDTCWWFLRVQNHQYSVFEQLVLLVSLASSFCLLRSGGKSQSRAASLSLCQRTTCILYDYYYYSMSAGKMPL